MKFVSKEKVSSRMSWVELWGCHELDKLSQEATTCKQELMRAQAADKCECDLFRELPNVTSTSSEGPSVGLIPRTG